MKKSLFYYLFAVLCAVNLFSSCSDDDNPSVVIPIDKEVAGTYKGKLDVTITQDGTEIPGGSVDPQFIAVQKAGDNAVSLSITDFSFMGIEIGAIDLNDCVLNANGDNYDFTGTTEVKADILTADVNAKGSFAGGTLKLDLDINAKLGELNQAVKVTYSGTRLKGDESSEAKITSFVFDKEVEPSDSLVVGDVTINEEAKTITFMVADTAKAEYLTKLVPTITVSEGATVVPASGEAQDFSNGKVVTYTVTAANGTVAEYKASISSKGAVYDFEDWTTVEMKSDLDRPWTYQVPSAGEWTGADAALQLIPVMVPDFDVSQRSLLPTDEAHSGSKAAKITTLDTKGKASIIPGFLPSVPKVTSGSLFLGEFETDAQKTLRSTRFGVPYSAKPIVVRGYYKYTPGAKFYRCDNPDKSEEVVEDPSKKDECTIAAVLYEVSSYATTPDHDKDERLDGTNIYTSDRVVAMKIFESGETNEYTPFELELEYSQEFNPEKLYRFAIICSSSKNGTSFSGAPGSTLYVDDIEVVAE